MKIPLLISLSAMKKAKTVIKTATNTANICGQNIKLVRVGGHYTISLRKGEAKVVNEELMDGKENKKDTVTKEEVFKNLMVKVLKEPGSWKKELTKTHSQMCHVIWHARHEDCIRVREEDGQELEREAELLKQENDKRNEEEPLLKEEETALPGTAEEEPEFH